MSKIHIVEDNVDLSRTYQETLEYAGHEVRVDHNGSQAVGRLPRFLPHVVILDMNLPGVSGSIVLSYIRRHPRLKRTKVLVVTGAEETFQTSGADLYLRKPISIGELIKAVSELANEASAV